MSGFRVPDIPQSPGAATPLILLTGWGCRLRAQNDLPQHVDRVLSKPPKLLTDDWAA